MKKILFIFLLTPLISIGQDKEIIELRNEINTIKDNLDLHHQQFRSGVIVSIIGVSVTIIANITIAPIVAIAGGVISLSGCVIMMNSDRYFGKKYIDKDRYQTEKQAERVGGQADETSNNNEAILQTNRVTSKNKKIEIQHHNWTIRHILKRELNPFDEVKIITSSAGTPYTYSGVLLKHGLNKLSLKHKKNGIIKIKYNQIVEIYKIQ
jgi:hypothetical protein